MSRNNNRGRHGGQNGSQRARYGDSLRMKEYQDSAQNGQARNLVPVLRDLVGGVNITWAALVSLWIAVGSIAGPLIVAGYLILPAKETDMKAAQASIAEMKGTQKEMLASIVRLDEAGRLRDHNIDTLDRKLDRLLDHDTWRFSPPPISPPAITPSQSEQNRRSKTHEDNSIRAN